MTVLYCAVHREKPNLLDCMNYPAAKFISPIVLTVLCLMVTSLSVLYFYNSASKKQIAFIRSAYLLENYRGMKDVLAKYNAELMRQQLEIDSLQLYFAYLQEQLKNQRQSLPAPVLREKEQSLQHTMHRLSTLTHELTPKAQTDKERLMQGALNQINFCVEQYAKENSISLVLGVTLEGNVLYGEDYLDITEEVLTELNKKYH
jgi:outer membrane protein